MDLKIFHYFSRVNDEEEFPSEKSVDYKARFDSEIERESRSQVFSLRMLMDRPDILKETLQIKKSPEQGGGNRNVQISK